MESEYSAEYCEGRAVTYRLFSGFLLHEVTREFLEQAATCPPVQEGALGEYFASLSGADLDTERKNLAAEFSALLLNMSPYPVMAYESVYTSPLRMLMQDSRDEVLAEYSSQGFAVSPELKLPEDHISFELEYMALLCEREADFQRSCDAVGLAACRQAEERFLRDHLTVWVFDFCEDLQKKAKSKFYRGLAESLTEFMLLEVDDFNIDVTLKVMAQ